MGVRRFVWLVLIVALLAPVGSAVSARQARQLSDSIQLQDIETPGYALDLEPIAAGFSQPTGIVDPGDGSGRLFVLERHGRIRIVQDGDLLAEPFLDISERVATESWEQGLLGLAFHPDFADNGVFYVSFSP